MARDLEWELQAYGMSKYALDHMVKTQAFPGTELIFAAGLLSDAQEMINTEYGEVDFMRAEDARQCLNRAKFILFTYVMKDNG